MSLQDSDILLYEKKDRIITITLNRPEKRNALSLDLWQQLSKAFERFNDDDDAWVAILTGAGDKSFCSGFDLSEAAKLRGSDHKRANTAKMPELGHPEIWKPIIGAINGYAVAGGFMLTMACDIRIAAEHAEFGIAETRWNMPAYWIADLTRWMTRSNALELVLWGDQRMSAQRMYEIGYVNRVVPIDKLMDEAMSWAERMLSLAPRCVRNLKEILYRGSDMPWQLALEFAKAMEQNLEGMEDSIEGPMAFIEKRRPNFKNK